MDYSSPALASYHLQRLYHAKVIEKNERGQYALISDKIRLGLVEEHLKIIRFWIPRSVITGILMILLGIAGIIFYFLDLNSNVWAIVYIPSTLMMALFLFRDGFKMSSRLIDKSTDQSK
jgi:DNA-binding transcriptional ArsR family regulator